MSEEDNSNTAVLLPSAQVTIFTRDSETKDAFMALSQDWRFARVRLGVEEGDVESAISLYKTTASPDLIIVQTEEIDDALADRLETLSASCSEGTAAIVIGPVNDVNLYRKLIGMGVSDYLVRPLKTEVLANDIAATLLAQLGATGSRLIALMGAKGGTGVTVLAEAMAWGLAETLSQKTFLLDAAGGWSTLSVGMDFDPSTTLHEAVRAAAEGNEDSLSRMVYKAHDKLFVLSSGGDVMLDDSADAEGYEALLDYLMHTYPVIVLDLSGATAALKRTVLSKAHEILLITTPTLPAVRATRSLLQEIKELRGGSTGEVDIIVNMQGFAPKHEVSKAQIEEGLERKPALIIPFDPGLFVKTESEAVRLGSERTGEAIVSQLLGVIAKVLASTGSDAAGAGESDGKKGGGLGDFLNKLKVKQ